MPPELPEFTDAGRRVALCEVLDRVLNKGVVVRGEMTISVAEVDLVYLALELVLSSMDTAKQNLATGLKLELVEKSNGRLRASPSGI